MDAGNNSYKYNIEVLEHSSSNWSHNKVAESINCISCECSVTPYLYHKAYISTHYKLLPTLPPTQLVSVTS